MSGSVDIQPSQCVTAPVADKAYRMLIESGVCEPFPCLRDECQHCRTFNELIDKLGDQCEAQGCTLRHCIHDHQ